MESFSVFFAVYLAMTRRYDIIKKNRGGIKMTEKEYETAMWEAAKNRDLQSGIFYEIMRF